MANYPFLMFAGEPPRWTDFLWGNHYVYRFFVSLLVITAGSMLVGIVSRQYGRLMGVVCIIPTLLPWLFLGYELLMTGKDLLSPDPSSYVGLGSKIMVVLLAITTVPIASYSGKFGARIGSQYGCFFDRRKYSILGVKWYHHIWLLIIVGPIFAAVLWGFAPLFFLGSGVIGSLDNRVQGKIVWVKKC